MINNNTSTSSYIQNNNEQENYNDEEKIALELFGLNEENVNELQNYNLINSFDLIYNMLFQDKYEEIDKFKFNLNNSSITIQHQDNEIISVSARWECIKYNINYYVEINIAKINDNIKPDITLSSNIINDYNVKNEQIIIDNQENEEDYPVEYYLLTNKE